jgi:hypothetical protein
MWRLAFRVKRGSAAVVSISAACRKSAFRKEIKTMIIKMKGMEVVLKF